MSTPTQHEYIIDGVIYMYNESLNCFQVTGHTSSFSASNLCIRAGIEGTAVSVIQDDAFRGCYSLRRIEIPISIQYLNTGCFAECENLRSVLFTLPKEPTPIQVRDRINFAGYVFADCESLRLVASPSALVLQTHEFYNCPSLETIAAKVAFESIIMGAYLFSNCRNLKYLLIDNQRYFFFDETTFDGCPQPIDLVCLHPIALPLENLEPIQHMNVYLPAGTPSLELAYMGYNIFTLDDAPI